MKYKITDKRLNKFKIHPKDGDAGIDLRACVQEALGIRRGELLMVHTGLNLAIPEPLGRLIDSSVWYG